MRKVVIKAAAVLSTIVTSACVGGVEPSFSSGGEAPQLSTSAGQVRVGIEAEFQAIADEVPEFAGYHRDADGDLVVSVVGGANPSRAIAKVNERAGPRRQWRNVRGRAGARYGIRDLMSWRDLARGALAGGEWNSMDVDEARNVVRVGVSEPSAAGRMIARLVASGIPAGAVEVVQEEAVPVAENVTSSVRPAIAGLRVRVEGVFCTLGPIVERDSDIYLMTNSHCTPTFGAVASWLGGEMWQPNIYAFPHPAKVGDEAIDPPLQTGGACPAGFQCRRSDAALFELPSIGAPDTDFQIARTSVEGTLAAGGLTIGTKLPIAYGVLFPLMGDSLKKTGGVSGTTRGVVTATCTDYTQSGTTIKMLCQDRVGAYIASGDSGSPVWFEDGASAVLYGMLWGGTSSYFVYSNMMNLENEVGPFDFN